MSAVSPLEGAQRVVIKIGSVLVADAATGAIRETWLNALAHDAAILREQGRQVLIVSSGAAAAGRAFLPPDVHLRRIDERQAASAVGQIALLNAWRNAFQSCGFTVAQVLIGHDDLEERRNSLNARATLEMLLRLGIVPVINENDTVATRELRYGDNDRLGARIAQLVSAHALVMLSSTDGLYTADPELDQGARHIPEVSAITSEIESMAGESTTDSGSGGMVTKLQAARIVTAAGCSMAIADGREPGALGALLNGARATWFLATGSPRSARKRWIASQLDAAGIVTIDPGAAAALRSGRSLLPAGVTQVTGQFEKGELILIKDAAGQLLGRGLASYPAADAARIIGHRSDEIEPILGYRWRDELVHRDDLVLGPEASST